MEKLAFDVEHFIRNVRDRPSIWDSSSQEYSDRLKKHACWLEICRIHYADFDEMVEKKRRDIGLELQKKWKNLRLAFVREVSKLKMLKSGNGSEKRTKYPYYDMLSFLLPVVSNKQTISNINQSLQRSKNDGQLQPQNSASSSHVPSGVKRSKKTKDTVENICDVRNRSLSQKAKAEKKIFDMEAKLQEELTDDEDKHFLLSLLSHVKKVPDDLKLQMRTEVMQVVMKYTQLIPTSHFVPPCYFNVRNDQNMPSISETCNFMEVADVPRPTRSSYVASSSEPSPTLSATSSHHDN
ncbi:uncharacterized protein LOC110831754 [Zootermopsis nevadensis]|uniref:MADF domain-containing protein n=1 Tax=Zootermopsis nevadensis TaxID=136037 RepID=A0A067R379_ZOONE|nr:uncharacterized protein LOC110831754 [Zootermopsis nevadensis]KDR17414.1 hypothetical protein L798_08445 [Zootermopsis nevadensis]